MRMPRGMGNSDRGWEGCELAENRAYEFEMEAVRTVNRHWRTAHGRPPQQRRFPPPIPPEHRRQAPDAS